MDQSKTKSYASALYSLITVFFFWGFLAASNGIFIPFCKAHFNLTQFESQLIDFTFYGGYFIGSLILYFASAISKIDILNKLGYKNGIILGLIISAVGALVMIPAINSGSFVFILTALFIITIGFSLQQTAANPFVVALGPPETGSNRLNFAGSINNIGALIGPVVISVVIFGKATKPTSPNAIDIHSVNDLYYIFAGLLLIVAAFFWLSKLPNVTNYEKLETSKKPNVPLLVMFVAFIVMMSVDPLSNATGLSKSYFVYPSLILIIATLVVSLIFARKNQEGWGAMRYPQLILGMIAIFAYVGTEVTIQSNMGALLKNPEFGGFKEADISPFIALYWGSLMIGRWTGAIGAFKLSKSTKVLLIIAVPLIAFCVVLGVIYSGGATNIRTLFPYIISVVVLIIAFFIGQQKPVRTLVTFGILGITFMLIGLLTTSMVAVFAFISGGLCCSIMFPSIFSLSVTGLGKYTGQGSAFLIMMILGGSIIPPIQGFLADSSGELINGMSGIHFSYIVPVIGFAYIAFFAWRVSVELRNQGIDLDHVEAGVGSGH